MGNEAKMKRTTFPHKNEIDWRPINSTIKEADDRMVVVLPEELERWLFSRRSEITALALAQPLFVAQYDDIEWATELVDGYLRRNRILFDEEDLDCQRELRRAACDYVLVPIANRPV
jgi:hypothetical protein